MLSVIVIQLLVLWLLGMATSYTMGGTLHLLLVMAIAAASLHETYLIPQRIGWSPSSCDRLTSSIT